jgi:tetratricopeptide (TPR) repeat protein
VTELRELVRADPEDRAVRNLLFATYLGVEQYAAAEDLVNSVLKINPHDVDALIERSQIYLGRGALKEAEVDLNQALHFKPDATEGHFTLALVFQRRKLRASARQEMHEALRLDPGLLPARLMLAREFIRSNEARAAFSLLEETPDSQKLSVPIVVERNWAYLALGRDHDALLSVNKLLPIVHIPDVILQIAILKFNQRDFEGARGQAEQLLRADPTTCPPRGSWSKPTPRRGKQRKAYPASER